MPNWRGTAVLLIVLSADLAAQRIMPSRLADGQNSHGSALSLAFAAPLEPIQDQPPPAPRSQFLAGVGGMLVGTAVGFIVRGSVRAPYPGLHYPLAGMVVGSTVGVRWYSHNRGLPGSFPMTLMGASLGLVGLYAAPVTVPLGATFFHNGAWRD